MRGTGGITEADIERFARDQYPAIVSAVSLACGSQVEAEDAVQEALARTLERRQRGLEPDDLAAWVVTVSLNLTREGIRQRRRRSAILGGRPDPELVRPPGELDHAGRLDLRAAVDALPRRQREVVLLHHYLDFDVRLTARCLNVSEGTVKTALSRGRASLTHALATDVEEEQTP